MFVFEVVQTIERTILFFLQRNQHLQHRYQQRHYDITFWFVNIHTGRRATLTTVDEMLLPIHVLIPLLKQQTIYVTATATTIKKRKKRVRLALNVNVNKLFRVFALAHDKETTSFRASEMVFHTVVSTKEPIPASEGLFLDMFDLMSVEGHVGLVGYGGYLRVGKALHRDHGECIQTRVVLSQPRNGLLLGVSRSASSVYTFETVGYNLHTWLVRVYQDTGAEETNDSWSTYVSTVANDINTTFKQIVVPRLNTVLALLGLPGLDDVCDDCSSLLLEASLYVHGPSVKARFMKLPRTLPKFARPIVGVDDATFTTTVSFLKPCDFSKVNAIINVDGLSLSGQARFVKLALTPNETASLCKVPANMLEFLVPALLGDRCQAVATTNGPETESKQARLGDDGRSFYNLLPKEVKGLYRQEMHRMVPLVIPIPKLVDLMKQCNKTTLEYIASSNRPWSRMCDALRKLHEFRVDLSRSVVMKPFNLVACSPRAWNTRTEFLPLSDDDDKDAILRRTQPCRVIASTTSSGHGIPFAVPKDDDKDNNNELICVGDMLPLPTSLAKSHFGGNTYVQRNLVRSYIVRGNATSDSKLTRLLRAAATLLPPDDDDCRCYVDIISSQEFLGRFPVSKLLNAAFVSGFRLSRSHARAASVTLLSEQEGNCLILAPNASGHYLVTKHKYRGVKAVFVTKEELERMQPREMQKFVYGYLAHRIRETVALRRRGDDAYGAIVGYGRFRTSSTPETPTLLTLSPTMDASCMTYKALYRNLGLRVRFGNVAS